jgi:hypothetical protein
MVKIFKFENLQEAWLGVNEYMGTQEDDIRANGGGVYGTELVAYNSLIIANTSWVDPNFDFGTILGYHSKKWTTLVKNYIDFNYLDLLKSAINARRGKKAKSYNFAFHFSNKYGGGKDCLISLLFTKKVSEEFPTVFFNVRVSEVTSRLIFDFLLVQRICEYIYGKDYPVEVQFFAPSMYVTAERWSMYASYVGWEKMEPKLKSGKFSNRIRQVWDFFQTTDVETIKYKAHKRCADIVQKDDEGNSVRKTYSLKAKNLPLHKMITKLPEGIETQKQINKYLKQIARENA